MIQIALVGLAPCDIGRRQVGVDVDGGREVPDRQAVVAVGCVEVAPIDIGPCIGGRQADRLTVVAERRATAAKSLLPHRPTLK